jgi:uncharacterized protein with von Willebrand factor type A (vWA) domain
MSRLESEVEIANPTQPHCAVVLLVDVSGSMAGNICEVAKGLGDFKTAVADDELA